MFQIAENRRWHFLISALVIVPGIALMIYLTVATGTPVRLSIDFKGGSLFLVSFEERATEAEIQQVYQDFGLNPLVQELGDGDGRRWQIRAEQMPPETESALRDALDSRVAPIDRDASTFDVVSPSIGAEVTQAALWAVLAACVVVMGFIWVAFRRVQHAERYGVSAILAMFHDVLVTSSAMALTGMLFGWEADALFVTAMLTVVGYSVQDTIVIFDRIRENLARRRGEDFDTVVNRSVLETVHRSLATQICAIFIMVAILLFGGETVRQFITILLVGLISGTYSSIFTAVPLLVSWEKGELPWSRIGAGAR